MPIWIKKLLYAGNAHKSSADERKHILITSLFSLVSIILLSIFAFDAIRTGRDILAKVILIATLASGCNYLFLYRTGKYQISSTVIVILMMSLSLYLLCTGGSNNSGPLWFYVMPLLIFYVLGLRRGFIILFLLMCVSAAILYLPGNPLLFTHYPMSFIHRFMASMFSVSVLACAYEYSREEGRKELLAIGQKLDELSRRDELTGLANRRDILERLAEECNRYERSAQPFSVLLIDLDHFKQTNDTYGHECGDAVLQAVSNSFVDNTQRRDTVARWGGEEFLILLQDTNIRQAHKVAERLRQAIEDLTISYNTMTLTVTVSIGIAEYKKTMNVKYLIRKADDQLYLAKHEGRNRVRGSVADL